MRTVRNITVAAPRPSTFPAPPRKKAEIRSVSLYRPVSVIPLSDLQQNNRWPYRISISVSTL
jgi:hypothetical protein